MDYAKKFLLQYPEIYQLLTDHQEKISTNINDTVSRLTKKEMEARHNNKKLKLISPTTTFSVEAKMSSRENAYMKLLKQYNLAISSVLDDYRHSSDQGSKYFLTLAWYLMRFFECLYQLHYFLLENRKIIINDIKYAKNIRTWLCYLYDNDKNNQPCDQFIFSFAEQIKANIRIEIQELQQAGQVRPTSYDFGLAAISQTKLFKYLCNELNSLHVSHMSKQYFIQQLNHYCHELSILIKPIEGKHHADIYPTEIAACNMIITSLCNLCQSFDIEEIQDFESIYQFVVRLKN